MEDKFLTIDNEEFLVIDEIEENGKKYIYVNSMMDEREVAFLEEYEENGEAMIKSVEDSELENVMKKFNDKLLGN